MSPRAQEVGVQALQELPTPMSFLPSQALHFHPAPPPITTATPLVQQPLRQVQAPYLIKEFNKLKVDV